jgi:uncharacterized protein YciW
MLLFWSSGERIVTSELIAQICSKANFCSSVSERNTNKQQDEQEYEGAEQQQRKYLNS